MDALVTDPIRWWASSAPDRPAITFDGKETIDFRSFDAWSDSVANHLADRGVQPGDRVGIIGSNSLEWCAAAIGALKAGAALACYQHRLVADEIAYLLADSEPSVVFAGPDHVDTVAGRAGGPTPFEVLPLAQVSSLRQAPPVSFGHRGVDPKAAAVIVYTSGTTARPKGVVYTHETIFSFILEWGLMEPAYTQEARMIFVLSLAGAPGILWALLHMLIRGGHLFLETGFDPATTLRRLVDQRIEIMLSVPVLCEQIALLPEFATADLTALRSAEVGGAPVPAATLDAWLAKGVVLRQAYGMTEVGGKSTVNSRAEASSRPLSVGRGSMFTRHRVVRPDGTDCEPGEPGEIIIKGPSLARGYWGDESAFDAAMRDGWFHSGDVGVFDEDGYLRVIDRMKDVIITGGFNVVPAEIEEVIGQMDGVLEVAVISVKDDKFGETPAAIVRAAGHVSADDIVKHCDGKLAGYKVPRHVVLEDEPLPRMPSGKLAKRSLRERFADRLASETKQR